MTEMIYKQLVSFGLDKHGFYGLIYSADNGANYKLLVGTQGRVFYPEDAQNFWPYLQGFVSNQIASAVSLTWDNIKGKPDVALKSDLPVVPTDLVHTSELEKVKSDVTQAKQDAAQAVANAESAKVTIDTSNIHQIKKPSEYSEGFSYELKATGILEVNQTTLGKSLTYSTIGLLTSVAIDSYGSRRVRQRFEVIDSDYPYTFVRTGTGNVWYPWHGITEWD